MLGLGLAPGAAAAKAWWPAGAVYAADFINGRYMRNGNAISAGEAFSFARASGRWAVDSTGFWRYFAPDVPAITDLGLSLEPAGTNLVPNPALTGAVAGVVGSGGSLPTGWSTNGAGLSVEVVAVTTLNGLPALHVRVSGTATGTFFELSVMPDTPINPNTNYAASIFLRSLAGPQPSVELRQADAGSGFVTANVLATGLPALDRRANYLTTAASTAFGRMRMSQVLSTGSVYNFSILVSSPQLELGSSVLSPRGSEGPADNASVALPSGNHTVYLEHGSGAIQAAGIAGSYAVPAAQLPTPVRRIWSILQ